MKITICDIKPDNVIIDRNLKVKLWDFGVSRKILSQNPLRGGSPGFLAPEIFTDLGLDYPCDVFSLGVLLHFMLTLDVPFVEEFEG